MDMPARGAAGKLLAQSQVANAALMRGDVATYRALTPMSGAFTLMSPFGGTPSRPGDMSEERWEAVGRYFRNGSLAQEVVETYGSPEMVVLVIIERATVEVGGLPAQTWHLRVTLVFAIQDGAWCLAHRHADPLSTGITLEQAAALAR